MYVIGVGSPVNPLSGVKVTVPSSFTIHVPSPGTTISSISPSPSVSLVVVPTGASAPGTRSTVVGLLLFASLSSTFTLAGTCGSSLLIMSSPASTSLSLMIPVACVIGLPSTPEIIFALMMTVSLSASSSSSSTVGTSKVACVVPAGIVIVCVVVI